MHKIIQKMIQVASYNDTRVRVILEGTTIFHGILSPPNLSSATPIGATSRTTFNFTHDKIDYELNTSFNLFGIDYILSSSVPTLPILPSIEVDEHNNHSPFTRGFMPTYTPILKYTDTIFTIIDAVHNNANKTIYPLIDVRKDGDIQKYRKDNFLKPHFLDLYDLEIMRNRAHRDEIKSIRNKKRKSPNKPDLPDEIYTPASAEEKIFHYKKLFACLPIIPTCRIDTSTPADSNYLFFVKTILEHFGTIVFRVMNMENFHTHISSYLDPFTSLLDKSYIILEFNGIKEGKEISILNSLQKRGHIPQIIYAKESADYENIKREYGDNYFENIALSGYLRLQRHNIKNIWFADYCGYDRNTATSFIPGMIPNASLYLLQNKDAKKICIYKVKVESERGTQSTKKSMNHLLEFYIKDDKVDKSYLDPEHCEACACLYTIESMGLAKAKTQCMKHNGVTIARL